jgi:MFS family permease
MAGYTRVMSSRLNRIMLSRALTGFICWYGVEKVFEHSIGISDFGIALLAVIYIAVSAILNIPMGVFADRYGRKYAIIIANVLLVISSLIGGFANDGFIYLISIVLWGIYYTTENGAYEALIYDTLKEEGREEQYARFAGLSAAGFWTAIFLSSIIGAWVGSHFGLRKAYYITLVPNVLNVILAATLVEAKIHEAKTKASSFVMIKQGFSFIRNSSRIINLAVVYLAIGVIGWMSNEFGQLFFIELGFSVLAIGLLNAFSGLSQAIGNFFGHRFGNISNRSIVVGTLSLAIMAFLLPVRFRFIGTTLFLLLVLVRNVFGISNETQLQHAIPSHLRATVLSALGMMNDGMLVVSYLCFGVVAQRVNVRSGYLVVIGIVVLLVVTVRLFTKPDKFVTIALGDDNPVPDRAMPEIDSIPK